MMDYGEVRTGVTNHGGKMVICNSNVTPGRSYKFIYKRGEDPTVWYCYDCHAFNLKQKKEGQPTRPVLMVKVTAKPSKEILAKTD